MFASKPFTVVSFFQLFFSFILRRITWIAPLVYLLLLLLFQPRAIIDNLFISAAAVWGEPSPHFVHVGYLLSYPMMWARMLIPQLEWFTVFQLLLNGVSIAVLAHYTLRPHWMRPGWKHVAGLLFLMGYVACVTRIMYYPHVSVMGMAAALILMLHGVQKNKGSRLCLGTILLIFAASVRYDSCLVLLPFVGTLAVLFLLQGKWKQVAVAFGVAVCVLGINQIQPYFANVSTWETSAHYPVQNLIEINNARMRYFDYVDPYEPEKRELYAAAGISVNDQKLLRDDMLIFEQRSSQQWWREMQRIRDIDNARFPRSLKELRVRFTSLSSYAFLASWRTCAGMGLAMLCLLCVPFPKSWKDSRLWIAAAQCGAFIMLIVVGRSQILAVWPIVYLGGALMVWMMPYRPFVSHRTSVLGMVLLVLAMGISALKLWPCFSPLKLLYLQPDLTKLMREECAQHPELRYWMWDDSWKQIVVPTISVISSPYRECRNAKMKNWSFEMPAVHQELETCGFEGDLGMFLNPKYRHVFKKNSRFPEIWVHYYKEHYSVLLHAVLERDLGETYGVYRVDAVPISE